jgi:hypothetical protein
MEHLSTHNVVTNFNSPPSVFQSGGSFKVEIPQSSVQMVKPISYDFRVAEYVNEKDEVVKVSLQMKCYDHDNYGVGSLRHDWMDVERVRLPFVG